MTDDEKLDDVFKALIQVWEADEPDLAARYASQLRDALAILRTVEKALGKKYDSLAKKYDAAKVR